MERAHTLIATRCSDLSRQWREGLLLLAEIGALLGLYVALERTLLQVTSLPAESYHRPVLLIEALRLWLTKPFGLAILAALAAAAWRYRLLGLRWIHLEHGGRLRMLVLICTILLAWTYSTYQYNFYFDRVHGVDRVLLLLLLPLIYARPAFIFPFLVVLFPILHQFKVPLGSYAWTMPVLPMRVLILFFAAALLEALTGRRQTTNFIFLLICLIASSYWVSGLAKLKLGWFSRDHIYLLLPATYANGWAGILEPRTLGALTSALAHANIPMKVGTLLVECGALFCLWRRVTLQWFLVAAAVFHIGVLLLSGISFWMWITLDLCLLLLFFGRRGEPSISIFTRRHLLLSVVLIAASPLWARPGELAWYDARATYTYRFEAVGASGRSYTLPPRAFAPYDYTFTLSGFRYLIDEPRLPVTWGATKVRAVGDGLAEAKTAVDVWSLEARLGHSGFDAARSKILDEVLRRRIEGGQPGRPWWARLAPPPHLWTFARADAYTGQEPVDRVIVHEITSFFDGNDYMEIRSMPVRTVLPRRIGDR